MEAEKIIHEVFEAYDFGGTVAGALRYGCGHINDTLCLYVQTHEGEGARFIAQRINTNIFKNPEGLMKNIVGVTDFLRDIIISNNGDAARETMTVLRTRDNKTFFTDSNGGSWRIYPFVEETVCLQKVEKPEHFYESAVAFGNFQRLLSTYPASELHETIEKFHDTKNRLAIFKKALNADKMGRAKSIKAEIDFVLSREADCGIIVELLAEGKIPLRVTHNDTKLNNILMDKKSGKGICVIDLDTVMPGSALCDFGDSIRFGANHSAEDEKDLSLVNFDIDLFDIYAKGYLEGCAGALTPTELAHLPWGAKLMTLECGIRFLTDYLDGDVYFKTHRDGQNLDRCRTQFKLVEDMEKEFSEMSDVVNKYC